MCNQEVRVTGEFTNPRPRVLYMINPLAILHTLDASRDGVRETRTFAVGRHIFDLPPPLPQSVGFKFYLADWVVLSGGSMAAGSAGRGKKLRPFPTA